MKLLLFTLVLISFMSCEPTVEYKRIIQNDSDYDIWIMNPYFTGNFETSCRNILLDSVAIARKTSYTLEVQTSYRSTDFFNDCPFICLDTLNTRIHNRDTLSLRTELYPSDPKWEYKALQAGDNGACECRLVITNSDIN